MRPDPVILTGTGRLQEGQNLAVTLEFDGKSIETKAVLFDKDGTINNSLLVMPTMARSRVSRVKKYLPWAKELETGMAEAIGLFGNELDPRGAMMVGSRHETVSAAAAILHQTGRVSREEALIVTAQAFIEGDELIPPEEKIALFPGAAGLLGQILEGGGKTAVVTNDIRASTEDFIRLTGLSALITTLACSDEVSRGKPHPDLVFLAVERLRVMPSDCIVVGDSVLDMEMARQAGAKAAVGVLSGSAGRADLLGAADIIIGDISEITCL